MCIYRENESNDQNSKKCQADKIPTVFYAAIILLLSLVMDRDTKDFLERLSLHFGAL